MSCRSQLKVAESDKENSRKTDFILSRNSHLWISSLSLSSGCKKLDKKKKKRVMGWYFKIDYLGLTFTMHDWSIKDWEKHLLFAFIEVKIPTRINICILELLHPPSSVTMCHWIFFYFKFTQICKWKMTPKTIKHFV